LKYELANNRATSFYRACFSIGSSRNCFFSIKKRKFINLIDLLII